MRQAKPPIFRHHVRQHAGHAAQGATPATQESEVKIDEQKMATDSRAAAIAYCRSHDFAGNSPRVYSLILREWFEDGYSCKIDRPIAKD
jgi:hypothetical protein